MATSKEFLLKALENANIQAALKTIRHCEGTSAADGYNYLFGSSPHNTLRFTDMSTHPNISRPFGKDNHSTAAGAYQFLFGTYQHLSDRYGIEGFDAATQDLLCVALFDQINVLGKIINGYFMTTTVQEAMGGQWASFPLSKYGQPTHSLSEVELTYVSNGGKTNTL